MRCEAEVLARTQVAVEERLVTEPAHPAAQPPALARQLGAKDARVAPAGAQETREDAEQGRLSGAVRAEHGEALTLSDAERDVAERGALAELAPQAAEL